MGNNKILKPLKISVNKSVNYRPFQPTENQLVIRTEFYFVKNLLSFLNLQKL